MNYLAEILAFNNWIRYNSAINKSDICLWHSLMSMANRFAWKEFTSPILTHLSESKLTKNEFYKSRNKLKQFGLIDFKERGGNKATAYKVNSVVSLYGKQNQTQTMTQTMTQSGTQIVTQTVPQNVNINKTKNQKPETKKKVIKKKFGEFENVFLSEEETVKLKAKLGEDSERYIERLSNYIESSGKRYKSHYATILSWAEKDKQAGLLRSEVYANNGKSSAKPRCTEYPE